MFKLGTTELYNIVNIKGGTGKTTDYTFITIEGNKKSEKSTFAEKLKINVWGKNLENTLKVGDAICIKSIREFGEVSTQDKNDKTKWYKNLTIVCEPEALIKGIKPKEEDPFVDNSVEQTKLEPIDDDDLPF